MIEVVSATTKDVDWLLEQMYEFEAFTEHKRKFIENPEHTHEFLSRLVLEGVVFIALDAGVRKGFVAGELMPHPFNPNITVLQEFFWWVPEEHRASTAAGRLLHEFENYGRRNADWVVLTVQRNSPIKTGHFEKRGFREMERAFLLEVGV